MPIQPNITTTLAGCGWELIEMYIHVKMTRDGKPTQIVKVECVVYQNKEVADLRYRGYKIANMELKDGRD